METNYFKNIKQIKFEGKESDNPLHTNTTTQI